MTDALVDKLIASPCHDEPMHGAWACGICHYVSAGAFCTKCGAPRWMARFELTVSAFRSDHEYPLTASGLTAAQSVGCCHAHTKDECRRPPCPCNLDTYTRAELKAIAASALPSNLPRPEDS